MNTLFGELHNHFSAFPNSAAFDHEIRRLEDHIEEDGYLFEQFHTQLSEIKQEYLSSRENSTVALEIFDKITQIIAHQHNNTAPQIIQKKVYNRLQLFTKYTNANFIPAANAPYTSVEPYIPKQYRLLHSLERISVDSKIAIAEYLVTGYHRSQLSINEYLNNNELFKQLQQNNSIPHITAYKTMKNYLINYEDQIAKPLPPLHKKLSLPKFKDDINIISEYITTINQSTHAILSHKTSYPLQLDVYFIAPNTHKQFNWDALRVGGIKSDTHSRNNGEAVGDIYRSLRAAALDMNKENGQRYVLLIKRNNEKHSRNDIIFIFKPQTNDSIAPKHISDYSELTYLLNSTSMGIDGVSVSEEGVLGLTHHLHSNDCNKVYLSYGPYKSRVFKADMLDRLKLLFDWHNQTRHIISQNALVDFQNVYRDFEDVFYDEIGQYWFNNDKSYECFEPIWDSDKCVADNVYIPNHGIFHTRLCEYIDRTCEYKQNNIFSEMHVMNTQTIYIKFGNINPKQICLIKTPLHKNEESLFMVTQSEGSQSKNLWELMDYTNVRHSFMTAQQICDKYGIFGTDLPKAPLKPVSKFQFNPTAPIFTPSPKNLRSITETHKDCLSPIESVCLVPQPNICRNIPEQKRKQSKTLFVPNYSARARLNIFIAKETTLNCLNMICEPFPDTKTLYYYLDISTALQINDEQMYVFDINGTKTIFIHYDLHSRFTNDTVYGIVGLNDDTKHQSDKWKWKLDSFLTAKDIHQKYGIPCDELPTSSRMMKAFTEPLSIPSAVLMNMDKRIVEYTNWAMIEQIKSAKKNKSKNRNVLRLNKRNWVRQCKKSWNDLPAIPMVIISKNIGESVKHWIEWVKLVKFNGNKYIGIACKCVQNRWEITSIILDKGDILNKHRLVGDGFMNGQEYLRYLHQRFNTSFTRIQWTD